MTISINDAIYEIDMIRHYQETIDMYEDDFKNVVDVKIRTEIDTIIDDNKKSLSTHQESLVETIGFTVEFDRSTLFELQDRLKGLQAAEKELDCMSDAWESGDACDMACNDPGLQFGQSREIENLWNEFFDYYKKS